ncbi:hypothetical protein LUZ60_001669 [Juncus effusus]|nr:hypothetical protein LUZ60_001669 [Juncus effusus]
MSRRQQPCRNFLSGHCRFGANCRFSHDSQNQNQNQNQNQSNAATNPFGFGSQKQSTQTSQQQQQQKPNPFGFGVQNTTTNNNSPFKTSPSNAFAKQPETQTQPSVHTCSDPEACKKIMIEDSKNEAPLWKLTSYGHAKNGPCDVSGDISCEELRALAYEESKQGRALQSIVEGERNLLQSKLAEFENLIRNPFVSKSNAFGPSASSFGNASQSPTVTSFSQLGVANNAAAASPFRPPAPTTPFGQSSPFQNVSAQVQPQTKFGFGTSNGTFGSQVTNRNPSAFGNGMQQPTTTNVSNFTFGRPALNANANANANQQQPSFLHSSSHSNQQSLSLGFGFLPASPPPSNLDAQLPLHKQVDTTNDAIWLKEKWSIGEIPEEAPPVQYC